MKNHYRFFLLTALLAAGATTASATVFRVNNNVTAIAAARLYTSLADAQTAASATAGDTIMLDGSATEYASPANGIVKKLTIIGPGYFLGLNGQNQANGLAATVRGLSFNPGSEGSSIIGLRFSPGSSNYLPIIMVNNISIIRCLLTNGISISASINGLLVLQNFIQGSALSVQSSNYSFSNVLLKSNIITTATDIVSFSSAPRIFSIVDNNTFLGNVVLETGVFRNNIIASPTATVQVTAGTAQFNLIGSASQLPSGANNTVISNPATLFRGLASTGNSTDGQYQLPTSSPYLTAGQGGTQPGAFGGTEAYKLSGIPPIPTIYQLSGDAVGSRQGGLNVTIGARTNQ